MFPAKKASPTPGFDPRSTAPVLPPTPPAQAPSPTVRRPRQALLRPALYSLVTLWYLLFQRLNPDHSLEAVLTDAQAGGANRLNRKLFRNLRSNSTCSYSDARQRLPLEFLTQALSLQAQNLSRLSPTTRWKGWVLGVPMSHAPNGTYARLTNFSMEAVRPLGNISKNMLPNPSGIARPRGQRAMNRRGWLKTISMRRRGFASAPPHPSL
jgi:hypothetical protein